MRGKAAPNGYVVSNDRITPAYAGKSQSLPKILSLSWDHPRLCGEKFFFILPPSWAVGSPPPMRGKAASVKTMQSPPRITPAYAGKSTVTVPSGLTVKDHPRLCGEKSLVDTQESTRLGSPPPMRGKDAVALAAGSIPRITPAYAGKSLRLPLCVLLCRDHPRLCGEKDFSKVGGSMAEGSPPPMRGKEYPTASHKSCRRITPAYAGKR